MTKLATTARLAMTGLIVLTAAAATGCASSGIFDTPAYSGQERGRMISRHMSNEWRMMQDDIDHLLLLRPQSRLTQWNYR